MKKIILIVVILCSISLNAQVPLSDELVTIHSVTTLEMNAIVTPIEGSFAFNTDDKHIYQYDGNSWNKLLHKKNCIKPLTASYTLTLDDDECGLTINSTNDVVLTVPAGLPIGYHVSVYQIGTGQITITGNGSVIRNRLLRFKTAGQDAAAGILCTSANVFHISGDLKR